MRLILKWRQLVLDIVADRRLALMLALGFGSGLPLLLVFSTQSAWLREAGVSRTDIGLMSYVALAYTFKFLWAPIIDAVNVPVLAPRLGRRRAWMLLAQAGVVVGLVGIAFGDPAHSLIWTIVCAFFVAFNGATQDVVVDAWRIDSAPVERQGLMAATYQLGYSIALVCAGAGALYIADFVNWKSAYFAMAALMAVGMAACLLAPRLPDRATSLQGDRAARLRSLAASFVGPVIDLIRRQGPLLVPILALVAVYRLPDFVYGVMANPLYIDLGFTKSEIATVSKIYGVWVGVAGAIGGGFAVSRLGLMPALFIGGVAASASHLTSAWLASSGARVDLLTFAVSLQSFASGFAGTALIAYMSSLTSPLFAATQYALLSSLYALPGKLVGGLSGVMVDRFGYPIFFVLTSAIGIPVMLLSLLVWRSISKTQYLSEEAEPAPM